MYDKHVSVYCVLATRIYFTWLQLANISKHELTDWLCSPRFLNCSFQTQFYSVLSLSSLQTVTTGLLFHHSCVHSICQVMNVTREVKLNRTWKLPKIINKNCQQNQIAFQQGMKCSVDTLTVFIFIIFILRSQIPQ